jgi:hypothetical protein
VPKITKLIPIINKIIDKEAGKKFCEIIITPRIIKKIPPNLWVFFQTTSFESVQGFLIPINQLGLIFFKNKPTIIKRTPTEQLVSIEISTK